MKLITGIFTGPPTQDRKYVIEDVWVKQLAADSECFYVYGDCKSDITCHSNLDLYLDCMESYESICMKTYTFYKYCYDHLDFDFILRIDDDSYCDVNKLKKINSFEDYTGFVIKTGVNNYRHHYGKCTDKRFEKPMHDPGGISFCAGGGYVISRRAIEHVLCNLQLSDLKKMYDKNIDNAIVDIFAYSEDRMIGRVLSNSMFRPINRGRWLNRDKLLYSVFDDTIIHPIPPKLMNQIVTPLGIVQKIMHNYV